MNVPYYTCWTLFHAIFGTYFRWRVYHPERVPAQGPVLLAANHASFMDPPLVGTSLRRQISYLARDTLFRYPGIGAFLRRVNAVPVDREGGGAAGLRATLECLASGKGIVLFPEGTRTRDGKLQRVRSGIGLVVVKSRAPVVPVRIFGSYEALPRGVWFPRPHRVVVKFGRPLDFKVLSGEAAHCPKGRLKEIYQVISDEIMRAIGRMQPHEDKATFP